MADLKDSRRSGPVELVLGRVMRAAGVGGGLAFVSLFGVAVVVGVVPCRAAGWGCLGYFMLEVVGALGMAAILAWPVLHMVKVRPAVPVVVFGPLAAGAIGWFSAKAPVSGTLPVSGLFVEAALGYGIAAFVTAGVIHWPWRVSAALAVVALVPLGSWLNTHRGASAYARELAGAGVPLLAPELPGYDVEHASADPSRRTLHYELSPRALPTTAPAYERAKETISVVITPVPPRFAPPTRCNFDDAYRPDQPCTGVGPDLWRRVADGPEVDYLTRRGSILIDVAQGGDSIDEPRLRRVVTSMSPHPAAYFRSR